MKFIKLIIIFIILIQKGNFGNISENFSGGGVSIEGKGSFEYWQYDINDNWDTSLYLDFACGFGIFPIDRLEIFLNPVYESRYMYDEYYNNWRRNQHGYIDIGAKYAFLLTRKESNGFVLEPGLSIGNHFDGYMYGFEYSISFCPFARLAYFLTSRFACFLSIEPRFKIRTKEPDGINAYIHFGAEYYFPRLMRILFKYK